MNAQTVVGSISELLDYVDRNNVNIKMSPGTYTIDAGDVASGLIDSDDYRIIEITGSNSTYDFTGVTFRFNTDLYRVTEPVNWGRADVNEFVLMGHNNVVKNLTIVEFGGVEPWGTALAVYLAGYENRIEGFHVTTSGSFPYGYGDMFGKGRGAVIGHHKHSGYLIHGDNNHLLNSSLIMKTYGHGIFFGGTNGVTIEGCTVEGELNTTDAVLDEEGTGSPADDVDFMTVFGYKVPAGWKFSKQEDGIRAYANSPHYLTGETVDTRGTTIIKNCTVKNMRSGVTIGLQRSGSKYVENTTVLGCEIGFWGGDDAQFVNCSGDASVGPLYSEDINRSDAVMDFTLLDNSTPRYGNTALIHLGGNSHNLTLKNGTTSIDQNLKVLIGGTRYHHRFTQGQPRDCANATIVNQTGNDFIIGSGSNGNSITSCGPVTDNGSRNDITRTNDCEPIITPSEGTFDPDPDKSYYIDNPKHNLRLAATGESEEAYTKATDATDADVKWRFVAKGNGFWHVQRDGGGTKPRLRSDRSENADMQETSSNGTFTYFDMKSTGSGNTYFFTLPDGPTGFDRLQVNSDGNVRMVTSSLSGSWESFTITEADPVSGGASIVHITKRNATGFAMDGNSGAENGQNIYLYDENERDANQQWAEVDRGGGYFSYQKKGTDFCIDGGRGGANKQNVYLWECGENNYNQHWQKTAVDGGAFKLIKRNASGFALDGGVGGANEQNIKLYDASVTSQNLHWFITPVGSSLQISTAEIADEPISLFPNPVVNEITITGAVDATVKVYNINGHTMLTKTISNATESLDVSSFSAGIYIVEIQTDNNISSRKIIKQ